MERWGSSYLLQQSKPTKLVGGIGATTEESNGQIRLSLWNTPGVLVVNSDNDTCELVIQPELAAQLVALIHILVLQNRILRNEPATLPPIGESNVFRVAAKSKGSFVCTWDCEAAGVKCEPHLGSEAAGQSEVLIREDIALLFMCALACGMAKYGTRSSSQG